MLGFLWLVGYVQALLLNLSLCAALRVVAHEWWLEEEALPHIRWASYSRMASGAVEVSLADGRSEWFDNGNQALDWVFGNGFVPAEMAIAPKLVQRAPAPPYGLSAEHAADACFQRRGGTNVPPFTFQNE